MAQTMELFEEVAKETSIFQAYQSLNSRSIRESLSIPHAIWKELEPAIQEKIRTLREKIQMHYAGTRPEEITSD